MAKLKDGFYKQTAESIGSDLHVLLAGGGSKAVSDFATTSGVVTALGTNGNYVTWTKNGTANNLTVPYATKAGTLDCFTKRVTANCTWGTLTASNGYTPIYWGDSASGGGIGFSDKGGQTFMQIDGDYYAQEGAYKVWHAGNLTKVSQLTNDAGYLTSLPSHNHDSKYFQKLSRPDTGFNIDEIELFGMRDIQPSSEITRTGTFPFDGWGSLMSFNGQNYFVQLATQGTSSGMYFRSAYGGAVKLTDKPWVKFLDSSNYSSYALPLSGGTITGTLTIKRNASAINYCSSGGSSHGWIGFSEASKPRVWMSDGSTSYIIWHAGNLTKVSQLSNDAGYLTSLPSHVHTYIQSKDNYTFTASTLPNSFDWGVSAGFVADNAGYGSYGSVLTVRTYTGGGGTLQLYAPYSKAYGGTRLKARFGDYDKSNGNSWTDLKEIAWTSDIPTSLKSPGTLTLSAGTFSAKTYDGSANVTVNIPTHTSHLTNNSSFMTETDVNNKISGFITRNVNTNTNTNPFIVSRAGGTVEALKIGVDDGTAHFVHEQDETVSDFLFKGKWNDTESGGGKSAGEKTIRFGLSSSDHNIYVGSSTVLHSGNYTTYTVKKDGTGATGTWGINISGNAGSATSSYYLKAVSPSSNHSLYYYSGQAAISGNFYDGSSNNNALYSFPTGQADSTGTVANVQVLRLQWDASYWHDIFVNPNREYVWHRRVTNKTAYDWRRFAFFDEIPTVTNYYWANVQISDQSSTSTNPTFNSAYASFMELSRTTDHGLKVGSIRGTAVGSRTGQYIHMYERVHIGSPNGWGSNDAPSYGLSTYGGAWLATDTGNVGIGTTNPLTKLHLVGNFTTSGDIYYTGSLATNRMIRFLNNTADAYGNGIEIGGGGLTVVGGGEAASLVSASVAAGVENLVLCADEIIEFYSNCQSNLASAAKMTFDKAGNLTVPGHIHINANKALIQTQASTSNYTSAINWYKGGSSQATYDPQIGQHNTGGEKGTGSICILPYATESSPWGGGVGLFISKTQLLFEYNTVLHSGNYSSILDGRYYTETEADNRFVNVTGDTMTGSLTFSTDSSITWSRNTDYASIRFQNTGDGDTNSYLDLQTGDNGNEYIRFSRNAGGTVYEMASFRSDGARISGNLKVTTPGAPSLIEVYPYDYVDTYAGYIGHMSTGDSALVTHGLVFNSSKGTSYNGANALTLFNNRGSNYYQASNHYMDGTVRIVPNQSNYQEGIRIQPKDSWSILMLLGTDTTAAASGTSTKSWGIFNNDGTLYINKGTSNGAGGPRAMATSTGWTFGNTTRNSYALNAASFICDSWVRTCGDTGWYNESYGGGWYMTDSTWVRSYNSKGVVAGGYYHTSYGSSAYALTSDGGVAHIGSMSVNYANSAGSASYAHYLPTKYDGGQQTNPQTYFNSGIGLRVAMTGMSSKGTSYWSDTLWINGYAGGDVPNMCALHFNRDGTPRMFISAQSNQASSYGTFYEVITGYNIGSQSVNYATSAGNADTTDGVHIEWAGSQSASDTTWMVGWTADGTKLKAVKQADLSVNYASYARYVYCTSGSYLNFQWSGQSGQPTWLFGSNDGANVYVWNPSNFSVNYANSAGSATNATNASNVYINTSATSSYCPVPFVTSTGAGNKALYIDSSTGTASSSAGVRYNPSSNALYCSGGFFEYSDETAKIFFNDIPVDFDILKRIPKKYFVWKDSHNTALQIGTSAQKLQEMYPELVTTVNGKLAVSYEKLSVVALKAIDELYDMIVELKQELNYYKTK